MDVNSNMILGNEQSIRKQENGINEFSEMPKWTRLQRKTLRKNMPLLQHEKPGGNRGNKAGWF